MRHQFFLFEDESGSALVTIQSELIKLPEAYLETYLSFELAAYDALATFDPHATLRAELPTKTTTVKVILDGMPQYVKIFHVPACKNGTGTWVKLPRLDKFHTSTVVDALIDTLNLKATS